MVLQELEWESMDGTISPGRRLCLLLLQARYSSVADLKLKAWEPCLGIVREHIGKEMAGGWRVAWWSWAGGMARRGVFQAASKTMHSVGPA